nr:hypothetical protein [Bacteroidota bacterium]
MIFPIFTTAYDEYAIQAFKVNSIDYLLKPIGISELKEALQKFKRLKNVYPQNIITDIASAYSNMNKSIKPLPKW